MSETDDAPMKLADPFQGSVERHRATQGSRQAATLGSKAKLLRSTRLFRFWSDLTEGLKTGEPQNEAKHGGDLFDTLYSDPHRLEQFLSAMTGLSLGPGRNINPSSMWARPREDCRSYSRKHTAT